MQSSLFYDCKGEFSFKLLVNNFLNIYIQSSPCPTPLSRVSIEVLIEKDQILPVRVRGVARIVSMARPPTILVWSKQIDNPVAELLADLEEVHLVA